MTETKPPDFFDVIDAAEDQIAAIFEQWMKDDAMLDRFSQMWRSGLQSLGGFAGPALYGPDLCATALERGGTAVPGGLGSDYPTGLFRALRSSWSGAIRMLALQQRFSPFSGARPEELDALAAAVDQATMPAFAPTPSRVVLERDGFRLRHVQPEIRTSGEPLVLLSPFVNRWYVLDFMPETSFVAMLSWLGRPVYLLETLPPSAGPDDRSMGDLCAGAVLEAIDHVRRVHDAAQVSLAGYCTGGTMAALFAARYPERVSRLATICAPIRFTAGGLFARWFSGRFMDVEFLSAASDVIPAWMVHLPFWWLRPTIKTWRLTRLCRSAKSPEQIEKFLANEIWTHDNMPMARGVFRSWVGELYQRDALVRGDMVVDGRAARLSEIRCPVLVVSGAYDAVVPPASAEALLDEVSSESRQRLHLPTTHTGVFVSSRMIEEQEKALRAWISREATVCV